jgi:fatty-acyl-CoA synthase
LSLVETMRPTKASSSSAQAWLRALQMTASIAQNPSRIFPTVVGELADKWGDSPALLSDRESLSYRGLAARAHQYARWTLEQGLGKGDVVGLLMTNRPEYIAAWVGITSVGGVVALLNTNLTGPSLAHCIQVVTPKHLIVTEEFAGNLTQALPHLSPAPTVWAHGADSSEWARIDDPLAHYSEEPLGKTESRSPGIEDRALYIYTSGTTGLPKAALVSHARVMQWGHWFAGMIGVEPTDRTYNCLPMYHSVGGVQVPGATLIAGGTVIIREKFSASQFWDDIVRWDCTLFQYIGELCRYLLHAGHTKNETAHRVRMACGNGLATDVWEEFQTRFSIPHIFEFYASTEGGVSLFNFEGKRGAIGHIPSYLAHRFSPALVAIDTESGEPVRNAEGFCVRCAANEPGEALGKLVSDPANIGSRFEGYTNEEASAKKILRSVFVADDAWVRTGDLMRKDERGYYYFVDRIGDTFRWKGENVSTSEVAEAMCAFAGIQHSSVYGVTIPATEGRAGMATLVADGEIDLSQLHSHLVNRLPSYARPIFLRARNTIDVTGTFKYSKTELIRQGYNPETTQDALYFDDPDLGAYVRLDHEVYGRIQRGGFRF